MGVVVMAVYCLKEDIISSEADHFYGSYIYFGFQA